MPEILKILGAEFFPDQMCFGRGVGLEVWEAGVRVHIEFPDEIQEAS